MKSNLFKMRLCTVVVSPAALFLLACASIGGGGKEDEKGGPKTTYTIDCKGDQAIRSESFEGSVQREGPVGLSAGVSCSQAEDLSQAQMKKLAREGVWTLYYKGTKKILGQGPYRADKREGEWKFQNKDGGHTRTALYANDEKNGIETNFFVGHGTWESRGPYVNDKKDGAWEIKIDPNGSCISKGGYSADKKNGSWKECAAVKGGKGYLAFEGTYADDLREGPATLYHASGKPLARGTLRVDQACLAEPPNGDKTLCSKRSGAWEVFHPNGRLAWEGSYDGEGKKTGTWTEYYQTGKTLAKGQRSGGDKIGTWLYYAPTGALYGEFKFGSSEFLVEHATLYENGRKTGTGSLKNALLKYETATDSLSLTNPKKSGRWVEFHSNGSKSGEGEYALGFRRGPWTHYDAGGAKIAEGEYSHDKKHGPWRELAGGTWRTIEYRLGKPK